MAKTSLCFVGPPHQDCLLVSLWSRCVRLCLICCLSWVFPQRLFSWSVIQGLLRHRIRVQITKGLPKITNTLSLAWGCRDWNRGRCWSFHSYTCRGHIPTHTSEKFGGNRIQYKRDIIFLVLAVFAALQPCCSQLASTFLKIHYYVCQILLPTCVS